MSISEVEIRAPFGALTGVDQVMGAGHSRWNGRHSSVGMLSYNHSRVQ
jgi:hypothetical protein